MVEYFFALFLVAIFFSLVLSVRSQRDKDEVGNVIKILQEQGMQIEGYIKEKYKFNSIEDAMDALRKLRASITDILYTLTEGIG